MNIRSLRFCLTAWYAGLLVCVVILFGAAVYFGLERYLEKTLRAALSEQARAVAEEMSERIADNRLPRRPAGKVLTLHGSTRFPASRPKARHERQKTK